MDFFRVAGVAHIHFEKESVELRFGQPVDAFLFDRILGGQHHEWKWQRNRGAVNGDLILLHRLQQGGLSLGRSAIDFVREQDLAEDRPAPQHEVVALAIEDRDARDVGRKQIGRELDALVLAPENVRKRFRERRLGDAGDALEQHVSVGQQSNQ